MTTIVYAGLRVYGKDKSYVYYVPDIDYYANFKKCLVPGTDHVGAVLECEVINNGKTYTNLRFVRSSSRDDSWVADEKIQMWHIEHRVAKDKIQNLLDIKRYEHDPIEQLIQQVRMLTEMNTNRIEKVRLARYVFEQLLK